MWIKKILLASSAIILLLLIAYYVQDKKTGAGNDAATKYELVEHWLQLPDSIRLGNPTGLGVDTAQNLFIFHRAGQEWPLIGAMPDSYIPQKTILLIDGKTGKLLNSWGENLFIMPHGLTVDKNNNVWVTDVGLHQVFKFTHDGELLLKLGEEKVSGNDHLHFNRPTDVAVADDGSFYVSDGYGNSRIIKFSASGHYLFEWGKKGDGAGEFTIPHSIAVDANATIYVADRENNRIQVFTADGVFIKQYASNSFAAIYSVALSTSKAKIFFVDDLTFLKVKHRGSDVFIIDSSGAVQTRLGRSGLYKGPVCRYHDIAIDKEETIYVGDITGNQVQKFKRTPALLHSPITFADAVDFKKF